MKKNIKIIQNKASMTIQSMLSYLRFFARKLRYLFKEIANNVNLGKMTMDQARVSVLATVLVFASFAVIIESYEHRNLLKDIPKEMTLEEMKKAALESKIKNLVKGTPIEQMVSYIAEKDEKTAAFLVAIAKKESSWGERKPVLNGEDCFNYWGYRGIRERMGSGGHTCFDSPEDAVETVGKRVSQIIERNNAKSAKNMIVWKCGSSCATHSPESVSKWISDVDLYAGKILN